MNPFRRRPPKRHAADVEALVDLLRAATRLATARDAAGVAQALSDGVRTALGPPGAGWQPAPERLEALRLFSEQARAALETAATVEHVRFLADHDALTGLRNRRSFMERLAAECARSRRYGRPFALVLCDLDRLKQLNDRHGHEAGDAALARLADVLRDNLRGTDGAFRLGGDEFALVLIEAGEAEAHEAVARVRAALPSADDPYLAALSASFGVAVCEPQDTPEALLRRADAAMYADKRARTP